MSLNDANQTMEPQSNAQRRKEEAMRGKHLRSRDGRLLLITAILVLLLGTGGMALADNGAVVLQGFGCGILVSPAGVPISAVFTTETQAVITPGSNAVLICHAELPPGIAPPRARVFNDVPCSIPGAGVTGESHTVVTPSGEVLLTCHFQPRKP
jgi:hypothetical protein